MEQGSSILFAVDGTLRYESRWDGIEPLLYQRYINGICLFRCRVLYDLYQAHCIVDHTKNSLYTLVIGLESGATKTHLATEFSVVSFSVRCIIWQILLQHYEQFVPDRVLLLLRTVLPKGDMNNQVRQEEHRN